MVMPMSQGEELEIDFKITLVVNFHENSTWKCTIKIVHSSRIFCMTVRFNYTCDVSQFVLAPWTEHLNVVHRILKSLKESPHNGIFYVSQSLKRSFYECKWARSKWEFTTSNCCQSLVIPTHVTQTVKVILINFQIQKTPRTKNQRKNHVVECI